MERFDDQKLIELEPKRIYPLGDVNLIEVLNGVTNDRDFVFAICKPGDKPTETRMSFKIVKLGNKTDMQVKNCSVRIYDERFTILCNDDDSELFFMVKRVLEGAEEFIVDFQNRLSGSDKDESFKDVVDNAYIIGDVDLLTLIKGITTDRTFMACSRNPKEIPVSSLDYSFLKIGDALDVTVNNCIVEKINDKNLRVSFTYDNGARYRMFDVKNLVENSIEFLKSISK